MQSATTFGLKSHGFEECLYVVSSPCGDSRSVHVADLLQSTPPDCQPYYPCWLRALVDFWQRTFWGGNSLRARVKHIVLFCHWVRASGDNVVERRETMAESNHTSKISRFSIELQTYCGPVRRAP